MMISSHFFGNIFAYTLFRDLEDIDGHTRNLVGSVLLSVTGRFGIRIGLRMSGSRFIQYVGSWQHVIKFS
jgi:hypothetical protein